MAYNFVSIPPSITSSAWRAISSYYYVLRLEIAFAVAELQYDQFHNELINCETRTGDRCSSAGTYTEYNYVLSPPFVNTVPMTSNWT